MLCKYVKMTPDKLFKCADFPVVRAAKLAEARLKEMPKDNYLVLDIDGYEVIVKKEDKGHMAIKCYCPECSINGIPKSYCTKERILCRRIMSAVLYLAKNNGRINELTHLMNKEYKKDAI